MRRELCVPRRPGNSYNGVFRIVKDHYGNPYGAKAALRLSGIATEEVCPKGLPLTERQGGANKRPRIPENQGSCGQRSQGLGVPGAGVKAIGYPNTGDEHHSGNHLRVPRGKSNCHPAAPAEPGNHRAGVSEIQAAQRFSERVGRGGVAPPPGDAWRFAETWHVKGVHGEMVPERRRKRCEIVRAAGAAMNGNEGNGASFAHAVGQVLIRSVSCHVSGLPDQGLDGRGRQHNSAEDGDGKEGFAPLHGLRPYPAVGVHCTQK